LTTIRADTEPFLVKLDKICAILIKVVPVCVDLTQIRVIGALIVQSMHDSTQV